MWRPPQSGRTAQQQRADRGSGRLIHLRHISRERRVVACGQLGVALDGARNQPPSAHIQMRAGAARASGRLAALVRGEHQLDDLSAPSRRDHAEHPARHAIAIRLLAPRGAHDADLAERRFFQQLADRAPQRLRRPARVSTVGLERPFSMPDSVALLTPISRARPDNEMCRAIRSRRRFAASTRWISMPFRSSIMRNVSFSLTNARDD